VPHPDCQWHHVTRDGRHYGTDASGHDVLWDQSTGRLGRIYSTYQRREAVRLADMFGVAASARELDIPRKTVATWVRREELPDQRQYGFQDQMDSLVS
jgi:hypothetical protein